MAWRCFHSTKASHCRASSGPGSRSVWDSVPPVRPWALCPSDLNLVPLLPRLWNETPSWAWVEGMWSCSHRGQVWHSLTGLSFVFASSSAPGHGPGDGGAWTMPAGPHSTGCWVWTWKCREAGFRWELGTKRRMGQGRDRRLDGAGSKPHSTSSVFLGWWPPTPKGYCETKMHRKHPAGQMWPMIWDESSGLWSETDLGLNQALLFPRTGEPGGLPSRGSHRVGHNWSDLAAAAFPSCVALLKPPFPPYILVSPSIIWGKEYTLHRFDVMWNVSLSPAYLVSWSLCCFSKCNFLALPLSHKTAVGSKNCNVNKQVWETPR